MKLIFEKSREGRFACSLPELDVPATNIDNLIPEKQRRTSTLSLPEVSEPDLVRHYTALSHRNHGVDSGFYPLGSCTMKYNPKLHETIAKLDGFSQVHPMQPEESVQGCLAVMHQLDQLLCEITGMSRFTLQPAAGAHGELTGLLMIKAWHDHRGDQDRDEILIPDSAHGTNPASAALAGFKVIEIASDTQGCISLDTLEAALSHRTAGIMLTNPNTLGLFEKDIVQIAKKVHQAGGLLYYDGANANAILGKTRPGDMGFDVVHLNLHKTFSTPHGGGGPGSGPVGVTEKLMPFLPSPLIKKSAQGYRFDHNRPLSIGRVKSFYGHFAIALRALAYILTLGSDGLAEVSETAVLNANYLQARLRKVFDVPFDRFCMHECVLSAQTIKDRTGILTLDIAKRLLDFGIHPPTIYFPLIVKEAIMIEPTETENKETLDQFIAIIEKICQEAYESPDLLQQAPLKTVVSRLDEVAAARKPLLTWKNKHD